MFAEVIKGTIQEALYLHFYPRNSESINSSKGKLEMKGFSYLTAAFLAVLPTHAIPTGSAPQKKADSSKVGYLAVYWTTAVNSVYFALSSNDDALGFKAINGNNPIVSPTLGTKAVRDVSIITGKGDDAGKYYILGTDLNIDTVCPTLKFACSIIDKA